MKSLSKIIAILILLSPITGSSQVFDGFGSGISNLGYKKGDFNYVTFGTDVGIMQHLSLGLSLDYAFSTPEGVDKPIFFEGRIDLHGANIIDLGKQDILLGYHNDFDNTQGAHIIYQYHISDFFGFYGRATYNFKVNEAQFFNSISDTQKFRFQLGIIFRTFAGWSGSNW